MTERAMASQPQPEWRAQQHAARRAAEEQISRQQAGAKARRAAKHRGDAEAKQQALDLSVSRRLVEATCTATAALEADAAYSKSVYDLPFFQEQAQLERERYLAEMMTAAGRGLLDSFTDVLNAHDVWDRLPHSERSLTQELARTTQPFRFRMELAELLTHHIPEVLLTLGYHPPPPAEQWTDLVQNSVQRLFTAHDDVTFARNSARARQELIFFTWRLRILVEAAEQSQRESGKKHASRPDAFLHSMRAAVTSARKRAIPTALAAGASAAVAGVGGGPAGMGIAFLSHGAASLLASATEAAATTWLAETGHGDAPFTSGSLAAMIDVEALDECIELMRSATSGTIESIRFIIRRGVFQTLQDAADSTVPVRDFLWDWSKHLLSLLDKEEFSADEAHQLIDSARALLANASNR